jgi:DNA-binding transcriptional regulator YhcF (GntR family)
MEFGNDKPIYLQIADHLCENILLEKWKAGDRIPSVREIAMNIEVNPNTVMRTFTYLQDKGIIFNKRGIGYFVAEDGLEKTRTLGKEDFVNNELPRFFKAMSLLHFTMEDVNAFYNKYVNGQSKDSNAQNL